MDLLSILTQENCIFASSVNQECRNIQYSFFYPLVYANQCVNEVFNCVVGGNVLACGSSRVRNRQKIAVLLVFVLNKIEIRFT